MQQPKRYQAPNLAEAYEQVRRDLGEAAVILSTRKAFAPGLFGQPGRQFVEVVARVPEESSATTQRPTLEQDEAAHDLVRSLAEAAAAAPLSASDGPFSGFQQVGSTEEVSGAGGRERSSAATSSGRASAPPPAAEPWSRQLDQMRGMLEQLVSERLDARIEGSPAPLRAVRERLVRHGLPSSIVAGLMGDVDAEGARDEASLDAAIARRLAAKLPPAVSVNGQRQRALFLVGPSGAGKTTMAVRIALDLERQHGLRVVVAGTDVARAGAPQQLVAFGSVTGLDVRLCYTPGELEAILAEPEVDLVIVDTPGHNGLRRDRMAELSSFLQVARQRLVLLTVPATMKTCDLSETISAYTAVGVDGLVLTRCDETSQVGQVAGVAMEAAIGLAFTTHSDQVSDGPAVADNMAFADAVVRAQWNPSAATGPSPRRTPIARPLAKVG